MRLARTIADLAPFAGGHLIPTMGALHTGHAALIGTARREAETTGAPIIVSIFVNPTQFNDKSDFDAYPRTLDTDGAFCERLGVARIFAPDVDTMYPPGEMDRSVALPPVATDPGLEDRFRPGHFEGVYRVCRRLFEIARPSHVYFGEKDWQQLQLIGALVAQERLPIRVVPVATVREPDGLALSSRNVRLSASERERARALSGALAESGRHTDPRRAEEAGREHLSRTGDVVEYFAIRDAETLRAPTPPRPARALVAARIGNTRLIDNAPWPGFTLP